MKQQIEILRTTVSQIQQSNASSIQANIREEILRQGIQETIKNVILEQLQSNSSPETETSQLYCNCFTYNRL